MIAHLRRAELEAGLETIGRAPADGGRLDVIVRRPKVNERETPEAAELDPHVGFVGDRRARGRSHDATVADRDTQLNVNGARLIALVARDRSRWPLAGDQLELDLDVSTANLPAGTQLEIGLRGLSAHVVQAGTIRGGDAARNRTPSQA